ncbi:nickel pincer cofactor biosynthesis protein LarC [Butyrivibrio sp. FCS014]|uniref:nickel pincer cofactor biosynthesis protein LarC n=1 Tax=Butyrivibrio sp. FCS014 TaxID=1408304 RepID=UPI002E8E1634|nr:nickel pincer cofactor biosynthesis protein LarC [Butyrivibrio sp. FCS014]
MRTLYLECKMGAAGDMLAASLLDLFENKQELVAKLNDIGIPKVEYVLEESTKCGIVGRHLSALIEGEEEHAEDASDHESGHSIKGANVNEGSYHHAQHTLYDIEEIIENLRLSKETKSDIREIYQLLAEAESKVHGQPVSEIHFHEVGELDAIADIVAVCCLMHELDPDKVLVSPVNVGGGSVKTAHGILPVPAPATAELLKEIPIYSSDNTGELCTPTGAALLKYFAFEFSSQPVMRVNKIGYGMGKKDFAQANCVRAILGETSEELERIIELSCNIDDMTPEEVAFATERLFEAGAVEAYTISIGMKKNRPGVLLVCMCHEDSRDAIVKTIFNHTTTIGIRENLCNRFVLSREVKTVDTPYGQVRVKKILRI